MTSQFVADTLASRRSALGFLAGLAGAAAATAAPTAGDVAGAAPNPSRRRGGRSPALDFSDPRDNLYAFGKIWGGYDQPVISGYHGLMYARLGNRRMIPVFGYAGTGVIQAKFDREAGTLHMKSRETAFFTDLATGDVLETWDNPFTGETVEVYHFYNPELAGRIGTQMPRFALGRKDDVPTLMNEGTIFPDAKGEYPFRLPFMTFGDDVLLSWDYTHDHTNPVTPAGWPKASVGPRITPSEHFTFHVSRQALEDRSVPSVRFIAGFARQSNFWPWMRMGGSKYADGILFGRMFSHKGLPGTADVHPKILAYLEKHAPEYLEIPQGWNVRNDRLDVQSAYAQDVPPENPAYEWTQKRRAGVPAPPTGSGSAARVEARTRA